MFLELINFITQFDTKFNVLNYLTIRALLAMLSALFISLMLGRIFIKKLHQYRIISQVIRTDVPKSHLIKAGTPTMGGILILFAFIVSILIWSHWSNIYLWVIIVTSIIFGTIGFIDDYLKIKHKSSNGLSSSIKFLTQSLSAIVISTWIILISQKTTQPQLLIPFFNDIILPLSILDIIIFCHCWKF